MLASSFVAFFSSRNCTVPVELFINASRTVRIILRPIQRNIKRMKWKRFYFFASFILDNKEFHPLIDSDNYEKLYPLESLITDLFWICYILNMFVEYVIKICKVAGLFSIFSKNEIYKLDEESETITVEHINSII